MKKLKINIAAAILDIIGASFYLIALIIAFTAQNYLQYLEAINLVTMIIWLFSLAGAIVVLIAFVKSKKFGVRTTGNLMGFLGHLLYFLFGIYLAPISLVLCILGAVFTFRFNRYDAAAVRHTATHSFNDVIDVDAIEVSDIDKE